MSISNHNHGLSEIFLSKLKHLGQESRNFINRLTDLEMKHWDTLRVYALVVIHTVQGGKNVRWEQRNTGQKMADVRSNR